jgi:hypothetical protein
MISCCCRAVNLTGVLGALATSGIKSFCKMLRIDWSGSLLVSAPIGKSNG